MNAAPRLRQWLGAARRRVIADTVLIGLPWTLALAIAGWRWRGPSAAMIGVAMAAVVVLLVAFWRARAFGSAWLIARLDARPALEDSSDLLLADPAHLNPLQRLQLARVRQRLDAVDARELRPGWSRPWLMASGAAGALIVAALLAWPSAPPTAVTLAPSDERVPTVAGVPRLVAQHLRVVPPAYTGQPARDEAVLDTRAPQGTRLQWTLRFAPQPHAAELVFHQGRRIALVRTGEHWTASTTLEQSVLYRVVPAGAPAQPAPRLHRIDAVVDRPPQVTVLAPDRGLSLLTPGQRNWPLSFEARDDYGVAAQARLRVTLAQGSGENIQFRERILPVTGKGVAGARRFDIALDLAALGFATGDDLIAQLEVADNRQPRPQSARSPSLILRWPSDLGNETSGLEGMVKKVLPAYFRSQRQIILDAEALQKEKRRLAADRFLARSDAIGVDQRILRLRYGQFLGEEAEGEPKPPPTNDAEDAHAEGRDAAHHDDDGHDHAGAPPAGDTGTEAMGREQDVLAEFGHTHDHAEAATLLDPDTRATLKQALDQMWQSELHLRQGRPDQALPFAYKALGFIKEVQQATRIYLARVGPELPPIDESRRLSGKREGLARRELILTPARSADAVPAAAWKALEDSAGGQGAGALDLDALQRWLRENEARVADPLSLFAAIDAVRGDPACRECRQRLRGLLWSVQARPPAQVRRRATDAVGERYLDALRREAGR
ncbi:hypothetical protein [Pseudoxanthomonas sp.]|uniref:hypothetical protein n=1 Tax=Pseudoxanthomonas sp. TaxID=1871049 RepID=UPI003F7F7B6C